MKPNRNSYCFDGFIDYNIINSQVKKKINFLIQIGFSFKANCEIRTTSDTWSLKYNGIVSDDIIRILIDDISLSYLEINKSVIRNEKMMIMIGQILIKYNPVSFRQSDDSIRYEIYSILEKSFLNKKIYFIGGEMVFYKALLNPSEYIMYTDYESIYTDSIFNKNFNTFLIDYEKDTLKKVDSDYVLIANTSKSGLGKNLTTSILNLHLERIVIISCNKKSFEKDFIMLNEKYLIENEYELKTNMTVWIIFLNKIC